MWMCKTGDRLLTPLINIYPYTKQTPKSLSVLVVFSVFTEAHWVNTDMQQYFYKDKQKMMIIKKQLTILIQFEALSRSFQWDTAVG